MQENVGILMLYSHQYKSSWRKKKVMKKHLERVWEDIVHLLEKEFPFTIQTPATPFECPPDELPSTTCQNPLQLTKLRTSCKECEIKRVKL